MTEEQELRRIHWDEVFSFTRLFKSFRIAMTFGKIGLALAAVVLVFVLGQAMDFLWAKVGGNHLLDGEIAAYMSPPAGQTFDAWKKAKERDRVGLAADLAVSAAQDKHLLTKYLSFRGRLPYLQDVFEDRLRKYNEDKEKDYKDPDRAAIMKDKTWSELLREATKIHNKEVDKIETLLDDIDEDAVKRMEERQAKEPGLSKEDRVREREELGRNVDLAWTALTRTKVAFFTEVRKIRGEGISSGLTAYEMRCLGNALSSVCRGNFMTGLSRYREMCAGRQVPPTGAVPRAGQAPPAVDATVAAQNPGFFYWALMCAHGILWLIAEHWVYAAIFLLLSLCIWAVLGGAMCRMAALHAARDEKISVMQALKFSLGKFGSFVTAPLLPLVIVLALGGALAVGGLLFGNWIGGILLGLLFFIALGLGLAAAFLLVGLAAGGSLMYPTIAVEGSDSFDAVSRSFSYVLNRPWRAGFYGLVSLVYGTLTYLFVRFFIYLALAGTHAFLKWGVFASGKTVSPNADKLDVLWVAPTFDNLWGVFNWQAMRGSEPIGAFLIGIWVFLMAAVALAYLLSYFASSTTMIYLLLRRKVDATDLDDVYVEEAEEPPASAAAPAGAPAASTEPAPPAGAGEKGPGEPTPTA